MVKEESLTWRQYWRIIPTREPLHRIFGNFASEQEEKQLERLIQATSPRTSVATQQLLKLHGPGAKYISASFAYRSPSRFSDGSYGVYYGARSLYTAIRETVFHRENFLRKTHEKPLRLPMRVVVAHLSGKLHDIRGHQKSLARIYSPTSYTESQKFARKLQKEGSNGIVYDSVRNVGGECAVVFNPRLLSHSREDRHLIYNWDGQSIRKILEVREYVKGAKK